MPALPTFRFESREASVKTLRMIAILGPVAFVAVIETLTSEYLESRVGWGNSRAAELFTVAVAGTLFALTLFRVLERMQRRIERKNEELTALNAVARALGETDNIERAVSFALEHVIQATGVGAGEIELAPHGSRRAPLTIRRFARRAVRGRGRDAGANGAERLEVPLAAAGEDVAVLRLYEPPASPACDEEFLPSLASQLAVAIQAANLFGDTVQRGNEARALYGIGLQIASLQEARQILDSVLEHARVLLRAEAAALCLSTEDGRLTAAGRSGPASAFQSAGECRAWNGPVAGGGLDCPVLSAGCARWRLAAGLRRGEVIVGELCVASHVERVFTEAERDLLCSLADMAAIAINNARLLEQERRVAVLEERARLSREMHDSLAQVLAYVQMGAEATQRMLRRGEIDSARETVAELANVARDAQQDVREAILALRETGADGFAGALRAYVAKFERQARIEVRVEGEDPPPGLLAGDVELQLLRVVQEALTNVRKHAHASSIAIRMRAGERSFAIEVEDDGSGFDPRGVAPGGERFGLQAMRERMQRIGGRLRVTSAPGGGTVILATLETTGAEGMNGANPGSAGRRPVALS